MGQAAINSGSGRARWEKVKTPVRRAAHGRPCPRCGEVLDITIAYWLDPVRRTVNPDYVAVDKIVPLSKGGNPFDPSNLRAMHWSCNSSRGNGDNDARRGPRTSTPW